MSGVGQVRFVRVSWERIGLVGGGLVCLLATPWFALAYSSAYGVSAGEAPPPWADWFDWPTLITADTSVSVYNLYGIIFGVALAVVVVSLAVAVRREVAAGTATRRAWRVITAGLGAVAVGSILEYGFGDYLDPTWGFLLENLGFLTVIIGTVLLAVPLKRENRVGLAAGIVVAVSGLVGMAVGLVLIGHLPSGPALIPILVCVVIGFTGIPLPERT